eukprot:TRINITY_DN2999_c0_g1_i1.p1 TRINITY_DN2999_c0_g1~~TRINITY_DN2999_c0_g1_i1.p1  ORF type:complete len:528 (-),score=65.87 TRINITY_DN2999_c0_g1_i1:154-1737(-)
MSIPERYLCPITQELMSDPVMDTEGHNFERSAIEQWLSTHSECPLSREPLSKDSLFPNRSLKEGIEEFRARMNQSSKPDPSSASFKSQAPPASGDFPNASRSPPEGSCVAAPLPPDSSCMAAPLPPAPSPAVQHSASVGNGQPEPQSGAPWRGMPPPPVGAAAAASGGPGYPGAGPAVLAPPLGGGWADPQGRGPPGADRGREQRVAEIASRLEISDDLLGDLHVLEEYAMVFVVDDSSSMNAMTNYRESRWQELGRTLSAAAEVAAAFVPTVDVFFLNAPAMMGVPPERIPSIFSSRRPNGRTPLLGALRAVFAQAQNRYRQQHTRTLVLVGTDGEPTDGRPEALLNMINDPRVRGDPATVPISFLACTDDDAAVGYLNDLDERGHRVDVVDDYHSERKEVLLAAGRELSRGDYVVKCLLGAVLDKYDLLDEGPPRTCVVCGRHAPPPPTPSPHGYLGSSVRREGGKHTETGWKCEGCMRKHATRAPPHVRCVKCRLQNPQMVYRKVEGQGWFCERCAPAKECAVM